MNAIVRWFASQHVKLITLGKVTTALVACAFLLRFLYNVNCCQLYDFIKNRLVNICIDRVTKQNKKMFDFSKECHAAPKWNRAIGRLHASAYVSGVVRAFKVHRDGRPIPQTQIQHLIRSMAAWGDDTRFWSKQRVDTCCWHCGLRLWPLYHSMVCCKYAMKWISDNEVSLFREMDQLSNDNWFIWIEL